MSVSKLSKTRITKNVYLNILGACQTSVKDQFMERGGWHLIFAWTNSAIATKNYGLLKEILNLLLETPVTIPRLKSNRFVVIFRNLWKNCEDEEVRRLCKEVLARWRKTANELQNRVTLKEDVKLVGGDASMTAVDAAGAVPVPQSADGGEGGSGQHSLVGWEDGCAPKDKFDASKVIQEKGTPPPSPVPEPQVVTTCVLVSSPWSPKKIMILPSPSTEHSSSGSKAYDVADHVQDKKVKKQKDRRLEDVTKVIQQKVTPPPSPVAEPQIATPVDKVTSYISLRLVSSPLSPKTIRILPSSSTEDSSSKAGVGVHAQDKKAKKNEERRIQRINRRKKQAAAKRREKEAENRKDQLCKISFASTSPTPSSSSSLTSTSTSGWKIPKKPSADLSDGLAKPLKLAKQFEEVKMEKPGATKKVKLEKKHDKPVMRMVAEHRSQVPEEFKKNEASVDWKVGGGEQVLKSCLARNRPDDKPKKSVSWKMPIEDFAGTSAAGGGNGQDRNSRNGDHQTNGFGGSRNIGDFLRIDGNGQLLKKKPSETLCYFFQKGRCNKGIRCNYLHDGASTSTSANQTEKAFPLPQAPSQTNNYSSPKVNGQGPNSAQFPLQKEKIMLVAKDQTKAKKYYYEY